MKSQWVNLYKLTILDKALELGRPRASRKIALDSINEAEYHKYIKTIKVET